MIPYGNLLFSEELPEPVYALVHPPVETSVVDDFALNVKLPFRLEEDVQLV
jgi:hypothetical protein